MLVCTLALWLAGGVEARAQDGAAEQQRLYEQMLRQPTNAEATYAYVRLATQRGDYEAAIGALERLLFYDRNLFLVKYELGTLYFRLGSYELARRYFLEASAAPDVDAASKARIEADLAMTEKQSQPSRFSGFAQTGLRYQTNASFTPSSNTVRFNGLDFGLPPTNGGKGDANWFGLVGLSHDYDLQDQNGTVIESRFIGYLTEQFRLHNLDVGLFDASVGPRFSFLSQFLPGATIKPYVVGGTAWVDGARYLSSGGAGLSFGIPAPWGTTLEPSFEWRRANYVTGNPTLAEFNSGNWYTLSLASAFPINESLKLDARGYFRRGEAAMNFQAFDQWVLEAALSYEFASPIPAVTQNWTISPFARVIRTTFDAPNPSIDPFVSNTSNEWVAGASIETAITESFGITTTIQYDRTYSTLPNYRQNNLSILSGPTARF
ncbi:MAG: tetratricopeptide repeat protein [Hyphomicrobiales bacterium]|nr:tetratricopeptide repeat protein [Hyphomicrobiales bacterium]